LNYDLQNDYLFLPCRLTTYGRLTTFDNI
jgi:hypothetical protein